MDQYEKSKIFTKRYKKIKILLKKVFGFDNFRCNQYEIINNIICGNDVCAIMSTGYGKSICFQIPGLYLGKPTIVVSPLISLMDDQRIILDRLGISSCCYNSNIKDKYSLREAIMDGDYQFIYITPESLENMKQFLIMLNNSRGISLFAIDEAHCISSYGFDFRKSYRELTFIKKSFPDIPVLALTATATQRVGEDICKVLGFKNINPIKTSFDRPNLYLEVEEKCNDKKLTDSQRVLKDLLPIIEESKNKSIIIYCLTKKETSKIQTILSLKGIDSVNYHAGLSKQEKIDSHNAFLEDRVRIMIATIAFGMGINKPNVRVVIHYGASKNVEGYYQEIGRAGRDGKKSQCYLFFSYRDFKVQESFIANGNDKTYQRTQTEMLSQMKKYVHTHNCRRQFLLEYFGEDSPDNCQYCDNCLQVKKKKSITIDPLITQDVTHNAKMLLKLIDSFPNRNFGLNTYINILRGSNSKTINTQMRQNKFYGKGVSKSVQWWKELGEILIEKKLLLQCYVNSGRFPMTVLKVSKEGMIWIKMSSLGESIDDLEIKTLKSINMRCAN